MATKLVIAVSPAALASSERFFAQSNSTVYCPSPVTLTVSPFSTVPAFPNVKKQSATFISTESAAFTGVPNAGIARHAAISAPAANAAALRNKFKRFIDSRPPIYFYFQL